MLRRSACLLPKPVFAALALVLTGSGAAFASGAEVRVHAKVETVAHTTGLAEIVLEPGESRTVVVQVAANFPWRLSIAAGNPAIVVTSPPAYGRAGGFATPGNTREIVFRCKPSAKGRQSGAISYSLART